VETVSDSSSSYSANLDRGYGQCRTCSWSSRAANDDDSSPALSLHVYARIKVAVAAALFSVANRFLAAISLIRTCNFTLVALRQVAEYASKPPAEYHLLLSCHCTVILHSASLHRSRLHLSFSDVSP